MKQNLDLNAEKVMKRGAHSFLNFYQTLQESDLDCLVFSTTFCPPHSHVFDAFLPCLLPASPKSGKHINSIHK